MKSKFVFSFSIMTKHWSLNPRFDLDLWQRCLFILAISRALSYTTSPILPECLMTFLDIITICILIAAVAKSSVQYHPEGRAVLITGKLLIKKLLKDADFYNKPYSKKML